MQVPEGRFEDLDQNTQKWLRDQHPRGPQIIAAMKSRDTGEEVTTEQVVEESDVPPYEDWKVEDLRVETEARELDSSGRKADLVKRLYAHDEETESQ